MAPRLPTKASIITALPVEREAVVRHLTESRQERYSAGTEYLIGKFLSWQVCVAQIAPGNSSAALETERAVRCFDPDLALFVGIAGGVKDVKLGDVVAATKIYGYEGGADREHFQTRPEVFLSSYPLVQEAHIVARGDEWRSRIHRASPTPVPGAFVGPVAAGAKVIKSSRGSVATLLRESYGDTLAVEMEGEGFMRAAYTNQVDSIVIRGISDLLDGKAEADKSGSQEIASDHGSAFAFELLARLGQESVVSVATRSGGLRGSAVKSQDPADFWTRLRELAPRLYPRGPDDSSVWVDAGGDLSALDRAGNGRAQWSRAIRILQYGGGGDISPSSLVDQMLRSFGKNYELQYLHVLLQRR
jgi:nucleoside phosphorylase